MQYLKCIWKSNLQQKSWTYSKARLQIFHVSIWIYQVSSLKHQNCLTFTRVMELVIFQINKFYHGSNFIILWSMLHANITTKFQSRRYEILELQRDPQQLSEEIKFWWINCIQRGFITRESTSNWMFKITRKQSWSRKKMNFAVPISVKFFTPYKSRCVFFVLKS